MFARFGISVEVISDNGPQFDSLDMKEVSEIYGFRNTYHNESSLSPNKWLG